MKLQRREPNFDVVYELGVCVHNFAPIETKHIVELKSNRAHHPLVGIYS